MVKVFAQFTGLGTVGGIVTGLLYVAIIVIRGWILDGEVDFYVEILTLAGIGAVVGLCLGLPTGVVAWIADTLLRRLPGLRMSALRSTCVGAVVAGAYVVFLGVEGGYDALWDAPWLAFYLPGVVTAAFTAGMATWWIGRCDERRRWPA